jgi:hypothetical protein
MGGAVCQGEERQEADRFGQNWKGLNLLLAEHALGQNPLLINPDQLRKSYYATATYRIIEDNGHRYVSFG